MEIKDDNLLKTANKNLTSNLEKNEDIDNFNLLKNQNEYKKFNPPTNIQNEFYFSYSPLSNSSSIEDFALDPTIIDKFPTYKGTLMKEQKNRTVIDFYNKIIPLLPHSQAEELINSHNFTFLKKFNLEQENDADIIAFYTLLYNLGGVSMPQIINKKSVDYSQKVCEFLIEKIKKNQFNIKGLSSRIKNMNLSGIKSDFTNFVLSNFDIFFNNSPENDFITKCYNNFEIIQETNTSNRGNQRQLKPTPEKFINYFRNEKFKNITPETEDIARTIYPYTTMQASFNDAIRINKERIEKETPNNILGFHLKEEKQSPFSNIDKISSDIQNCSNKILKNLSLTSENEFTFDWLERNDPQNFILGKFCSCCSHLEGAGYAVMRASIVSPNVQNLVIRDKDNKIIAKSTLYINRKYGYGVFNNVEVNNNVPEEQKNAIYKAYIRGTMAFISEYNKIYSENPITKVNVGSGNNDLIEILKEKNEEEKNLLTALNYDFYGNGFDCYTGDSGFGQYIIYEKEQEDLKEKANEETNYETELSR